MPRSYLFDSLTSVVLLQIDLKHLDQHEGTDLVQLGIDLAEYYPSVEWDIMGVPAQRNEKFYPCCVEPYPGKTTLSTGRVDLLEILVV